MSGPKISVYELTGWAKSVVLGQIRCERDSVACAKQIAKTVQEASSYKGELERILATCELADSRNVEAAVDADYISSLITRLEQESQDVLAALEASMPHISIKYTISDEALADKKEKLSKLKMLKKRITELRDALDSAVHESVEQAKESTKRVEKDIADSLSGLISYELLEIGDAPTETLDSTKKRIEARLHTFAFDKDTSDGLQSEIRHVLSLLSTVSTIKELRTYEAITVKGLERRITEYKRDQIERRNAFEDNIGRYETLCQMAGENARAYQYSPEALLTVQKEIERLELLVIKEREQAYISESVDEVMRDMGYELIGKHDVRKRSGKRFRNELYSFNEGTGVNITYSPDGQIAMELGGLSREDRLPSEDESRALTEDMESFCGEFAEFERRIREKGIALGSRIALAPPSAEYAAIINVSDYDIDDGKQVSLMSTSTKRSKATEKKAMRRND